MSQLNLSDIKLALTAETIQNIQKALERRAKILGRVRTYETSTGSYRTSRNSDFVGSPYELAEIARAIDVEPYILQSVRKHRTHILKEGYEIYGTNEETVNYVNNRLFEISLVTGIPTVQWIRDLITNIVTYHNGMLIYRRDASRSSGKPIQMYGKKIDPIAGIFVGDPISMQVELDKYGTPLKWKQQINSADGTKAENLFDPEDVVHIPVDRKTGMAFGTPYLVAVLDDVRALRKLEELVLVISEKEAFPLYHYKVGTENKPAMVFDDGSDEVSAVMTQLAAPSNGYVVTSERHEINLISRDKASFDLRPVLDYFEARVLAGLSLSPVDLGRGSTSNRGTASVISKNLEDSAKDYQSIISAHITQFLVVPLLFEGGFDVTLDNMVYFKFPMIDREELRAHQNHGLQLMLGNAITVEEFRKEFLNKEGAINEEDTILSKNIKAEIEVIKNTPKATTGTGSSGGSTTSSVARAVANRSRPANQYGSTTKSRTKKKNDSSDQVLSLVDTLKDKILNTKYTDNIESDISAFMHQFVNDATKSIYEDILEEVSFGFSSAEDQYFENCDSEEEVEELGTRAVNRFINNYVSKSFWKVLNPIRSSIANNLTPDADGNSSSYLVVKSFEVLKKSIKSLLEDQKITANRFGFAKFAKRVGYKNIDLVNNNEETVEQINIADVIYKNLMPTDGNASLTLKLPLENRDSETDI